MFNRFLLGVIEVKPEVKKALGRTPLDLVARHAVCEFGGISREQFAANCESLDCVGEIISEYNADPTKPKFGRIRVTTIAGWGRTRVELIKRRAE